MGIPPKRALADPDLAFNLSVMRAAQTCRQLSLNLKTASHTAESDPFGVGQLIAHVQLLAEDL